MRASIVRWSKVSPKLKELRIHLCQTGEASKGVRYAKIKSSVLYNSCIWVTLFYLSLWVILKIYVLKKN